MRISCYDDSNIKEEVNRCLSCKNPSCEKGCPIHNQIRDFIKALKEDDLNRAKELIYNNSNLAFICSIVCPHEKNCMGHCILNKVNKPINIGTIEGYISASLPDVLPVKNTNRSASIIGAGPAGIYAAIELRKAGFKVTIYEKENYLGGVLAYGIPDFRLNKDRLNMLNELISRYKIEVKLNTLVDNSLYDKLVKENDYLIIACGLSKSRPSGLGANEHILEASQVLKQYNYKAKFDHGIYPNLKAKKVFVMGAGNVAMDVARVAKKLGADTTIIYRRSLAESPANKEEIEQAMNEGVIFRFLENPIEAKVENGKLKLKIEKMELGAPDESGRRRPIGTNSYSYEDLDYLIEAIGDMPNFNINEIEQDHGYFITDDNFMTSNPKVYAIGDVTLGAKTVVEACYSAKVCANAILKNINE